MIKKLSISLGIFIFIGLILIKINSDFTWVGFLERLKSFPNLKSVISSVSFPAIPKIPIPDVIGIKYVVIALNKLIEVMFSIGETSLALIKVVPKFLMSLLELIRFAFGV